MLTHEDIRVESASTAKSIQRQKMLSPSEPAASRGGGQERGEIELDPRVVLTEGWYGVEQVGEAPVRWTRRRFAWRYTGMEAARIHLFCHLPPESGLLGLRGTLLSPGHEQSGLEVRVGPNELVCDVPGGVDRRGDVVVEFTEAWIPSSRNINSDYRELALFVHSLRVSPLPEATEAAHRPLSSEPSSSTDLGNEGAVTLAERELRQEVARLRQEVDQLRRLVSPATGTGPSLGLSFDFDDRFRGPRQLIKERQRVYLPFFLGLWNVLDLGSGRGEFLELLDESGSDGWGVDLNADLVEYCRKLGLRAVEDDAVSYLGSLGNDMLDGIFSAQLLEHLTASQREKLLEQVFKKLRPGGIFLAETVNPNCLSVFSDSFYLDPSHVVPIPPDLLDFELRALGFQVVEILFSSPVEERRRLPPLPDLPDAPGLRPALEEWRSRLNTLLFGDRDYAIVARRPL